MEKLVLAYSGGLDTSVMIRLMKEKYGYNVITVTADVGQADDLAEVEEKSKLTGAPMSLYDAGLATYDASTTVDQTWPNGFIEIRAMPTVVANARRREHPNSPMQYKVAAKATTQTCRAK